MRRINKSCANELKQLMLKSNAEHVIKVLTKCSKSMLFSTHVACPPWAPPGGIPHTPALPGIP